MMHMDTLVRMMYMKDGETEFNERPFKTVGIYGD